MLTEEDVLNDLLTLEKNLSNNYSIAINEMSNDTLYKKIMNIFEDTKDMAREVFNLMEEYNYYSLSSETDSKINTSYKKYSKKYEELK